MPARRGPRSLVPPKLGGGPYVSPRGSPTLGRFDSGAAPSRLFAVENRRRSAQAVKDSIGGDRHRRPRHLARLARRRRLVALVRAPGRRTSGARRASCGDRRSSCGARRSSRRRPLRRRGRVQSAGASTASSAISYESGTCRVSRPAESTSLYRVGGNARARGAYSPLSVETTSAGLARYRERPPR
jgi:hypothetical protein